MPTVRFLILKLKIMYDILLIGNLAPTNIISFNDVEAELRLKGHSVINPVRRFTLQMNNTKYFTRRYLESITQCSAVYFMPDAHNFSNIKTLIAAIKALEIIEYNIYNKKGQIFYAQDPEFSKDEISEHINY